MTESRFSAPHQGSPLKVTAVFDRGPSAVGTGIASYACDSVKGIRLMHAQFTLLIADRNRNVRDFLRREFISHGYCVRLAKDDRELLAMIEEDKGPDLIILDLEMPYTDGPEVLERLQGRMPALPVVVYTLMTDHSAQGTLQKAAAFLEKRGNNVDDLKALVEKVLREWYPHRYVGLGGPHEEIVDVEKGSPGRGE